MEIARNLWRRKLRNSLTITGIVIGVLALTTLGALAAHIDEIVNGGLVYYSSSVQVSAGGDRGGSLVSVADADQLRRVPGVTAVNPSVSTPLAPGSSGRFIGPDDTILNWDPSINRYSKFNLALSGGQFPTGARGEVLLGDTVAREYGKRVGDAIALPVRPAKAPPDFVSHTFTVVGITAPTGTIPDYAAWVSLADAQTILHDQLSPALRGSIDTSQLAQSFAVYGNRSDSLSQLDAIADGINKQFSSLKAVRPSDAVTHFREATTILTAITTGAALLSLVIGGLSVVNTMFMAVSERVREIGLKKAVGASTRHLLGEFLAESAAIGLLGGVAGWVIGLAVTVAVNARMGADNQIFSVTPGLTAFAIGFAVALGAVAGLLPAWRAARLDPVTALRST